MTSEYIIPQNVMHRTCLALGGVCSALGEFHWWNLWKTLILGFCAPTQRAV